MKRNWKISEISKYIRNLPKYNLHIFFTSTLYSALHLASNYISSEISIFFLGRCGGGAAHAALLTRACPMTSELAMERGGIMGGYFILCDGGLNFLAFASFFYN